MVETLSRECNCQDANVGESKVQCKMCLYILSSSVDHYAAEFVYLPLSLEVGRIVTQLSKRHPPIFFTTYPAEESYI